MSNVQTTLPLGCHNCGDFEIRFVNRITAQGMVYIFACAKCGTSDIWAPLDARQLQEISIQMITGRDLKPPYRPGH